LARRQEALLVADEALGGHLGTVCPGLRDITATGAQAQLAAATGERVEAELRAARALARWGVLRVASLAIGGQLPIVLLLATAPWLLSHGVTTGALVGALAYVTQSLLPALRNLVHGLGTSGSRLTVVLRRLTGDPARGAQRTAPALAQGHTATEAGETPATAQGDTTTAGRETPGTAQGDTATATHETPGTAEGDGAAAADETRRPNGPSPQGTRGGGRATTGTSPRGRPDGRGSTDAAGRTADGQDRATADVGTPGGNAESARAEPTADPPPALSLTSVTFAYGPASSPVVDGLDLALAPGAHLAVVGPSGAGKSTLTALVAGLLTPDRGTITVGGHAVPGPEAAAARVLIPQEAYVFDGTLAERGMVHTVRHLVTVEEVD
ncbi:ATP-binding cassette domain-containing protein, partial [Streptomyces sp. NPDC006129]|uniref:ATP-binding cassette domain-containing protein n=1 Tax=Streptomyces sp. NPDC006129 TaxID=3155348 RepID=UPI0033AA2EF5